MGLSIRGSDIWTFVPSWRLCLGMFGRYSLAGGSMSITWGWLWELEHWATPLCFLLILEDVSSRLRFPRLSNKLISFITNNRKVTNIPLSPTPPATPGSLLSILTSHVLYCLLLLEYLVVPPCGPLPTSTASVPIQNHTCTHTLKAKAYVWERAWDFVFLSLGHLA